MTPQVVATIVNEDPQIYEDKNVHAIYEEIAPHFSLTRYKPWPIIAAFLSSLPTGWVGLDAGTGNGKYLPLDRSGDIYTIGLDRSRNLLEIAKTAGGSGVVRDVIWGDVLGYSWRPGVFDYAISIATIHHLTTHDRRKVAVKRLLQSVSPIHGRVLIYVWAIEQDELSKRQIPTHVGENTTGQDVVVPWVLSRQPGSGKGEAGPQIFNRYYHMFARGELARLIQEAAEDLGVHIGPRPCSNNQLHTRGMEIVQDGWERSNYYAELQRWELSP